MIAQYLSTQANTLICAYFVDLNSTSSYGVITQIGSMMGALAASYYAAYQPQYSSLCLQRQNERLKKLTCRSIFAYKIFFLVYEILLHHNVVKQHKHKEKQAQILHC